MKKVLALLLLVCLCLTALAETRTIGLINEFENTPFWKENPDVKRNSIRYNWRDGMTNVFLNTEGADVMHSYTRYMDMDVLLESGMVADLSKSEKICEAVNRMHPDVQRLITDEEGHILALPSELHTYSVYWMPDAWEKAGFTEADVPQSYTELLDFLEAWIARIQAEPEKNLCVSRLDIGWTTAAERASYVVWLMTNLRYAWEFQQRYAGQKVNYNDPEFIALAERALAVGRALNDAEPSPKKRLERLELFHSELEQPMENNGRNFSLGHTIPLRITRDQPALTAASSYVCLVRGDTGVYEDVLGLLESYLDVNRPASTYALYTDTQPFHYDGERKYSPCTVTERWLEDFRSYTGTLVFYPFKGSSEYGEMDSFYLGQTTAQELALGLNAFIGYEEPF